MSCSSAGGGNHGSARAQVKGIQQFAGSQLLLQNEIFQMVI